MRRLSLTAFLAAITLLYVSPEKASANPPGAAFFGCGGHCFKMFPHIHQHGPLFNYGPYYGYYPFCPYGPWDAYLRFDPNFYGNANPIEGDVYGLHPRLRHYAAAANHLLHPGIFHNAGSHSLSHLLPWNWPGTWSWPGCSFHHASWSQGGWFRGHHGLNGGHCCATGCAPGCGQNSGCGSPSGTTVPPTQSVPAPPPTTKLSGIGTPSQSAVYYRTAPSLDPRLEFVPRTR